MKKVLSIVAIVVFSMGLYSCDADNSAEDQTLYEQGTDGDDTPTGGGRTQPKINFKNIFNPHKFYK